MSDSPLSTVHADPDPKPRPPEGARPKKRLAVFLDGTWNDPADNTNVWRLHVMAAPADEHGIPTLKYYDPGVGTNWYDRLTGGAIGYGLSDNVQAAYQWLMEHYEPGDHVFVFGFSRGAFTARSLVGFTQRCGLLLPGAPISIPELFDRYRRSNPHAKDSDGFLRPIHEIVYDIEHLHKPVTHEEQVLYDSSPRIPIEFVGVFDTVGALGVPFGNIPGISSKTLGFHNTNLGVNIRNAYQALAVDEHRKPYRPTLWNQFSPKDGKPSELRTNVEQRWFIGAHANVGGGYGQDALAMIPLDWMYNKARERGLPFRHAPKLYGNEHTVDPRDSFGEFLGGVYRAIRFNRRFYRIIGRGKTANSKGFDEPINEQVDDSVLRRYKEIPKYRPPNLADWMKRVSPNA